MSTWEADDPSLEVEWWSARAKHIPGVAMNEFENFIVALRSYNSSPTKDTRMSFGIYADRLLLALVPQTKVTIGYMLTSVSATARKIGEKLDKKAGVKNGIDNTRLAVKNIKDKVCGKEFVPDSVAVHGANVPAQYNF